MPPGQPPRKAIYTTAPRVAQSVYTSICPPSKKRRHPVAQMARDGGGGGTADPSLSRRAGLCLHPASRMRGVLFAANCLRILVPAHCNRLHQPAYESLQGRPEVGPLPTPRRCHSTSDIAAGGVRVRRCEPRCHSALAGRGDYLLIEPASENPTQSGLHA